MTRVMSCFMFILIILSAFLLVFSGCNTSEDTNYNESNFKPKVSSIFIGDDKIDVDNEVKEDVKNNSIKPPALPQN